MGSKGNRGQGDRLGVNFHTAVIPSLLSEPALREAKG